jgi:cytochrome c5
MRSQTRRPSVVALVLRAALVTLSLVGCGGDQPASREGPEMPRLAGERLEAGRTLWVGTCRACHLMGVAGAPAVTNFAEWDQRLPKGVDALYQSAMNGIRGSDGQFRMPPRGGNKRLSDEQVRLALEYKVAAIKALQGQAKPGGN